MELRKIICPIDFSPGAREAFAEAVDQARRHQARLTLLHVMTPVPVGVPEALLDTAYVARLYEDADRELEGWRRDARAMGIPAVDVARLEGTPWDAIVDAARRGGHDLVVLSTHGRTGLAHAFIGSVTEKVVRHAPCSVLVVRPRLTSG
jgi:universal stress protein A